MSQAILWDINVTTAALQACSLADAAKIASCLQKQAFFDTGFLFQIIYDIGDDADRFFIILMGTIEVFTHPPGTLR